MQNKNKLSQEQIIDIYVLTSQWFPVDYEVNFERIQSHMWDHEYFTDFKLARDKQEKTNKGLKSTFFFLYRCDLKVPTYKSIFESLLEERSNEDQSVASFVSDMMDRKSKIRTRWDPIVVTLDLKDNDTPHSA
jgi:hypothetical protein